MDPRSGLSASPGIVLTGFVIFNAIWVLAASVAFWTVDTKEMTNAVTYGGFWISQYALDVPTPWLRRLVVVLPMAFVTYLPSTWILGKHDGLELPTWAPLAAPAVALALCLVAATTWQAGIRAYRSTGT